MINYETILSSYDDKLTLMQWLKKVEAALKDASATGFHVNKRGNATITFSIDFENGETLESEPLVLQQGESVESGEIRNGHLFLTLTNGDELDCGALFNGEVPSLNVRSLEVSGGLLLVDDANAAIGGDLVVHGLTEVENIRAYGDVETESLTAAGDEISAKKPVVEVMNGYSFNPTASGEHYTITPIYAGVCKNGNKVTFAFSFKIAILTTTAYAQFAVGRFGVPSSLYNKLVETTIGSVPILAAGKMVGFRGSLGLTSEIVAYTQKIAGGVSVGIDNRNGELAAGNEYYLRYETTFLLSENLVA